MNCINVTSRYQLLHPDWRRIPHNVQHGWTEDHEALLQTLHHKILSGQIASTYYTNEFEYEKAVWIHQINSKKPLLGKPVASDDVGVNPSGAENRNETQEIDYDADDEFDVRQDIAYTEPEIAAMNLCACRCLARRDADTAKTPYSARKEELILCNTRPPGDGIDVSLLKFDKCDKSIYYREMQCRYSSWEVLSSDDL